MAEETNDGAGQQQQQQQQAGAGSATNDGGKGTSESGNESRTFSQEEVDRIVQNRLARIGDVDELRRKADEFDKIQDAAKTEQEKLADQLEQAKNELAQTSSSALKLEVALAKAPAGMEPAKIAKLAQRLTGATREELEQDATELFADFAPSGSGSTNGGGNRRPAENLQPVPLQGGGDTKTDMNEWMRQKTAST